MCSPVVVAGCTIDKSWKHDDLDLINDSKRLSETERDHLFDLLTTHPEFVSFELAILSPNEIDQLNILAATLKGMDQVIHALELRKKCDAVLIDGPHAPPKAKANNSTRLETIKGGDGKVRAIAAASILAKVTRDRLMVEYDGKYPGYGFAKHKGYGVVAHMKALSELGPCEIHRESFAPVKRAKLKLTSS